MTHKPPTLAKFHLFPDLCQELRDAIWHAALSPELSPRVLSFGVKFESSDGVKPHDGRDPVFLTPGAPSDLMDAGAYVVKLARITTGTRALASTNREARALVLRALPDILPFRGRFKGQRYQGILRYDGERDLVTLHRRSYLITPKLVAGLRQSLDIFAGIRNLGLEVDWITRRDSAVHYDCNPATCTHCREDGVSAFLACFPRLRTLSLVVLFGFYKYSFSTMERVPPVEMCACMPVTADGESVDKVETTTIGTEVVRRHDWLLLRSVGGPGDWFISYIEDWCSIPPLEPLEDFRQFYPGWPYRCECLKHLGVGFRIVRRLQEGPPVSRWLQETDGLEMPWEQALKADCNILEWLLDHFNGHVP
jgi:hypothetical protein